MILVMRLIKIILIDMVSIDMKFNIYLNLMKLGQKK